MSLKICLLITDDADDHHAFSEALSEYDKTVVLIILESEKAMELLRTKNYSPDYVFIDLSMHGIKINTFLKAMKTNVDGRGVPIVVYGDRKDFEKIDSPDGLIFFSKDYEYSQLKKFLTNLIMQLDNGH